MDQKEAWILIEFFCLLDVEVEFSAWLQMLKGYQEPRMQKGSSCLLVVVEMGYFSEQMELRMQKVRPCAFVAEIIQTEKLRGDCCLFDPSSYLDRWQTCMQCLSHHFHSFLYFLL